MRLSIFAALALALVVTPAGAEGGAHKRRLVSGQWGGPHVSMTVTESGASVEYDCAHGTVDRRLKLDVDGRFSALGTHVREHGGPVRRGEPEDKHPARYTGEVRDGTMLLTVTLVDTGEAVGQYTLTLGSPGQVFKCK